MIETTSGMGVGFVHFGVEPISVDSIVALPTLVALYRVPSALPLPAWDTTAIDDRFNSCAFGQLMDTCREQP
jgi:hypothetical protein